MKVLLWTPYDRSVASARLWTYEMADMVRELGLDVSVNRFERPRYDVAMVQVGRPHDIARVLHHSPDCRIGISNQGETPDARTLANHDFALVGSVLWEEMLLPRGRRLYRHFDFPPAGEFPQKVHRNEPGKPLVLGYCGNETHFRHDFFPHGAKAVQRLAREMDLVVRVVTNNAARMAGLIPGVRIDAVEWALDTHAGWMDTFDIGLNPSLRDLAQLAQSDTYIRNSNRVRTLLFRSIPSVASPLPESCMDLRHEEHVLYAWSEEGWFHQLRRLAVSPELRQRLGDDGRAWVRQRFSRERAAREFRDMLVAEATAPLFPKRPEILLAGPASRPAVSLPGLAAPVSLRRTPQVIRHPAASAAVVVACAGRTGDCGIGAALGASSHCLSYADPFDPAHTGVFPAPHSPLHLDPAAGRTLFDPVFQALLEGRLLKPGAMVRTRPRLASACLIESARANLLLGYLHRRYGCRAVLVIRHPAVEIPARLAAGLDDGLDALLAQPSLARAHLEPHLPLLRSLGSPLERHTATWCIEHLVPLREVPASALRVVHAEDWDREAPARYRELAEALGLSPSPRTAARLAERSAAPVATGPETARILELCRTLGADWHEPHGGLARRADAPAGHTAAPVGGGSP